MDRGKIIMKYKYIGTSKYWNSERTEQIVPGAMVDEMILAEKFYESIKASKPSKTKEKIE